MKRKIIITFAAVLMSFRIMADNTLLVGTIDVNATVSESGGAVVSIPIDVPAGINGMQPNLALVYNSQGGLGTCGWGWSLSGLSSITRTGSTPYYDNDIRGVQFDDTDNLRLDGQRLLLESGDNLTAGAVYRTEVESWSKITFKATTTSFEVKTKDGVTAFYGNTDNSQLADAPTPGKNILAWNISKVTDMNGNYMTYNYTPSYYPGESYINKIAYTGHTPGMNPVKEVTFEYDNLTYPHTFYEDGSAFANSKVLRRINIRSNNQDLWHYVLEYDTTMVHYRLSTVTKVAANGDSYPPVELTWSTLQEGELESTTMSPPSGVSSMPSQYINGDFNGDGKMDFCTFNPGDEYCAIHINTTQLSGSPSFTSYKSTLLGKLKKVRVGDYNGDGKDDLIICFTTGLIQVVRHVYWYNWTGSSLSAHLIESEQDADYEEFSVGDFDGDGRQEVFFPKKNQMDFYNGTTLHFEGVFNWDDLFGEINTKAGNNVLLDFNGNGKTDIIRITSSTIYVYEFEVSNTGYTFSTICNMPVTNAGLNNNSFDGDNDKLQFGDFNGDGKTDIVCTQKHSLGSGLYLWKAHILLSDGTKFIPSSIEEGGKYCFISDCNNDGLSDYFFCAEGNGNEWYLNIGLNKGNKFEYYNQVLQGINGNVLEEKNIVFFDIYGDGRGEFLHYKKNTSGAGATLLSLRIFTENPLLLTKVKDGNGLERNFTYQPVCNPDVYTSSYSATDNVLPLKSALHVVSSLTAPYTSLHYTYSDGRIHRKGKGFMGFITRTVTDSLNNRVTTQTSSMDGTHFFLKPNHTIVSHTNGQNTSRIDVLTANKTFGTKRFWPYVTRSISQDFLTTLSDTTWNEYDNFGNLTRQRTATGSFETESNYRYIAPSGAEYPYLVRHSMSRSRLGTEWSDSVWTDFKYDDKGRLVHEVCDSLSTTYSGTMLSSHYKYDSFGHVIRTVTKDSLQTRTSSATYLAGYPYSPSSSTDVLGMVTTYYYNTQKALTDSITDGAGRKTKYQYDSFGRLWKTIHPDDSETVTTRRRVTNVSGASYSVAIETTNTPAVATWYNASGMPILEWKAGFDCQDIYTVTRYKANGQVACVSEPFEITGVANALAKTFTAANATFYTYDAYGRTSTTQSPVGTTNYSYSGLTTTTVTPEGTIRTVRNTSGLITSKVLVESSSSSPSRSVSYTYYPTGEVKTITPQGSTAVHLSYDRRGRRTKLIDPDAGTVIDRWGGLGQLLSHRQDVHNGNVETTYSYGATTGLLLSETTHGATPRTKTYTYSSTFKDQPTRIAYSTANYVAYTYDTLGRMTQTQKVIGGETITDSYTYDPDDYGLLTSHSFNGNVTEYYTYDGYGYLVSSSLSPSGTPLWELLEVNPRGQVVREKKSGITTTYTYDEAGRVDSIVAPGIMNFSYQYDAAGNTHYKYDGINYIETTYSYDNKNRLTGWEVEKTYDQSSYRAYAMSYSPATGNILSKTDLGANTVFSYAHATKPHALTGITNYPDTCSLVTTTYTDFGKIQNIARSGHAYSIDYLPDGGRGKSTWSSAGRTITRYYGDSSEKVYDTYGAERDISYLSFGGFVVEDWILPSGSVDGIAAPTNETTSEDADTLSSSDFLLTGGDTLRGAPGGSTPQPGPVSTTVLHGYYDAQGSLIALVNTSGTVVRRYAFDPWGKRVSPTDWTQSDTRSDYLHINRGYTMHEHLDDFGLINMNGRVFDPATAQFLSPDNYIQFSGNWLNYNRYAYCFNNPLRYTDPSGECLEWLVFGAVVAIGGYQGYKIAESKGYGFTNWQTYGYIFGGAAIGALSGYFSAGIAASSLPFANTIGIMAASHISSVGTSILSEGQTDYVMSFGAVSYNATQNEWGYLGKKGNTALENIEYGLGCLTYYKDLKPFTKKIIKHRPKNMFEINDEQLIELQKEWFPNAPMEELDNFTIDNVEKEILQNMTAEGAFGQTIPSRGENGLLNGRSSVYFNKELIASYRRLYYTMGHELVHVGQITKMKGLKTPWNSFLMEFGAYSYSSVLGDKYSRSIFSTYGSDINMLLNYSLDQLRMAHWTNFEWLKIRLCY